MFPCPHCGKAIEVGPAAKVPWWQYDSGGPNVSLGCGTLILIAIIVAIFSGGNKDEIRALRNDFQALEKKIDKIDVKLVAPAEAPQVPAIK
jgi:hypothetical protein